LGVQSFDAIISDMRMPGMNGAEFLQAARTLQPRAVRLLLTGHADAASALQAVNQGEVFRYFTKPWDDAQLAAALNEGVERERLRAERDRLLAQVERQNAELQTSNHALETRVAERTAALQQALARSDQAHRQLKQGFTATMHMLCALVEARAGLTRGTARRVVEHVRRVGPALGLAGAALQDAIFAAMLVDLGKLLLPERLLLQPCSELVGEDRQQWLAHPQHAHALLLGNPSLEGVAELLRSLHEHHDGHGLPDRRAGDAIPMGSRLLAVAVDYEAWRAGAATPTRLSAAEALKALHGTAGKRHDPRAVAAFAATLPEPQAPTRQQLRLPASRLEPGMELAEDLCIREGFALLTRGITLDQDMIGQLQRLEERSENTLSLTVYAPAPEVEATDPPRLRS
jgi:response regulator RpfG family c-di-GMP phosphodiesterase